MKLFTFRTSFKVNEENEFSCNVFSEMCVDGFLRVLKYLKIDFTGYKLWNSANMNFCKTAWGSAYAIAKTDKDNPEYTQMIWFEWEEISPTEGNIFF